MKIKVLLIGLGQIGMMYDIKNLSPLKIFSHARATSFHPRFELIGAVDPSSERISQFQNIYNKPAFSEIAKALEGGVPELAIVATPTETHASIVRQLLEQSRPKIILCEKPLSMEFSEASSMVEDCEKAGVKLFANYMRRVDPGMQEIKKRIGSGKLGSNFKGVCWYSKGLINNGSHFLDLLEFWLGPYKKGNIINYASLLDKHDPEPDLVVHFKKGSIIFQSSWEEAFSHYTIELISRNGRLRVENNGREILWQGVESDPDFPNYRVLNRKIDYIPNEMNRYQWNVMDALAQAFDGQPTDLCTGRQALQNLAFIEALNSKLVKNE